MGETERRIVLVAPDRMQMIDIGIEDRAYAIGDAGTPGLWLRFRPDAEIAPVFLRHQRQDILGDVVHEASGDRHLRLDVAAVPGAEPRHRYDRWIATVEAAGSFQLGRKREEEAAGLLVLRPVYLQNEIV